MIKNNRIKVDRISLSSIFPPGLDSKTKVSAMEDDCCENGDPQEGMNNYHMRGYPDHEFPKPVSFIEKV